MATPTTIPKRGGIGSDDFKKLVIKNSYVDKSLFVKDIIEDSHDVILITRPRRWGKSSNMSLLQTFLGSGTSWSDEDLKKATFFKMGCLENIWVFWFKINSLFENLVLLQGCSILVYNHPL